MALPLWPRSHRLAQPPPRRKQTAQPDWTVDRSRRRRWKRSKSSVLFVPFRSTERSSCSNCSSGKNNPRGSQAWRRRLLLSRSHTRDLTSKWKASSSRVGLTCRLATKSGRRRKMQQQSPTRAMSPARSTRHSLSAATRGATKGTMFSGRAPRGVRASNLSIRVPLRVRALDRPPGSRRKFLVHAPEGGKDAKG